MPDGIALSDNVLNISGALFGVRDTSTPLLSGMPVVTTDATKFILGATYDIGTDVAQPSITEVQSLTAPDPKHVVRTNTTNVVQPFHETVAVSYMKQSNTGTLAGNDFKLAGLENNVPSELSFQIARTNEAMRNTMENMVLNAVYQEATDSTTAGKTRGLIPAITTNVVDAEGAEELNPDILAEALQKAVDAGIPLANITLLVTSTGLRQITKNWVKSDLTAPVADRNVAGFAIKDILTDFGMLTVAYHRYVPAGTAVLANLSQLRSVVLPTPGKGNFFYEALAKTGASERGQIFGQWGVDYGHEFKHGKIINLATTVGAEPVVAGGGE